MQRVCFLKNKKLFTITIVFVMIMSIGLLLLLIFSNSQYQDEMLVQNNKSQQNTQILSQRKSLPDVMFASYELNTHLPSLPNTLILYKLKTNFDESYAKNIADKLFFVSPQVSSDAYMTVIIDNEKKSILKVDAKSGGFFYFSEEGIPVDNPSTNILVNTTQLLEKLGIQDGTLGCTAWYTRASINDGGEETQFVECHRLWTKASLPILSILGASNLGEHQSLNDARLGKVFDTDPRDEDIIFSSDNRAGYKRPNDFNTLTVALTEGGARLRSLTSSIRPIETRKEYYSPQEIHTPDQAIAMLFSGKATLSLTKPAGQGMPDLEMVYPDNKANAQLARIDDFVITYLENPASEAQAELIPMYIIKGVATLSSGYDITFVETIPAVAHVLADSQISGVLGISTLAQATSVTGNRSGVQYGTFIFGTENPTAIPTIQPTAIIPTFEPTALPLIVPPTNTPIPTIKPTTIYVSPTKFPTSSPLPTPTSFIPTPTDISEGPCPPFTNEYLLPNGAKLAFVYPDDSGQGIQYYYIPTDADVDAIQNRLRQFSGSFDDINPGIELSIAQSYVISYLDSLRLWAKNVNGFCQPYDSPACLISQSTLESDICYIVSLASPNIYLYSDDERKVEVKIAPRGGVYYNDPPFIKESTWVVNVDSSGVLTTSNGVRKNKLYYEYERHAVTPFVYEEQRSKRGYVVEKHLLSNFAQEVLVDNIGLSQLEARDLVLEIKRMMNKRQWDRTHISFLSDDSIDTYFPLTINPQPEHILRVYFYVREAKINEKTISPLINNTLIRSSFYVIETGIVEE